MSFKLFKLALSIKWLKVNFGYKKETVDGLWFKFIFIFKLKLESRI